MIPQIIQKPANFLSPERVIDSLEVETGSTIIDFGCGPGFWVIPLAKRIGHKGVIYAIDPKVERLSVIKSKAEKLGLSNIEYIQAPLNSPKIPVEVKADLIIISNVLSMIKNDQKLIESTKANSGEGSKLVVIDWEEKSIAGPEDRKKSEIGDIIIWAKKAGFEFKRLLDAGDHHFGLYFEHE